MRLVGLVPVGLDVPLRAVPLHDARPVGAHVVLAGGLHRAHDLAEAQGLEPVGREVEVLEAPAHLLGREHLALAVLVLRGADRLHLQHGDHHPARVRQRAHARGGTRALALVIDELLQVVVHLVLRGAVVDGDGVVALGTRADVLHVVVGAGPPDAVDLLARVAAGLRLADAGGRHHAGRPEQHVVGLLLADLQPGGFLLHAGRRDGEGAEREAVGLGALLQQRDGLLAVGAVVVDQRDLLALEAALFLLGDVLQHHVGGGPVGAQQREIPLEHRAVGRLRETVARGLDGDLVHEGLVGHREGDAGGLRVEAGGAAALALEALVAFHALGRVVGGLAFLERELDAVHAAVARVHQLEVVLLAVRPGNAERRELPGAVDEQRHELLARGLRLRLRLRRGGERGEAGREGGGDRCDLPGLHGMSPWDGGHSGGALGKGFGAAPVQCGNGQMRSFCRAVDHSRARPCGSTMRKNTISAPKIMCSRCVAVPVDSGSPSQWGT